MKQTLALIGLLQFLNLGSPLGLGDALAQGDGETEVARQRFQEGVQHYDRKDYEKARLAFLQAYLLKPHPAVLLNLAQSELRAGRYAEAAENFAKYIRENPSSEALGHAKASLEEARPKVAEVRVEVTVPAAAVSVDGTDVGRSPLPGPVYLMPGRHVISATKGRVGADRTLEAVAGQELYVSLQLLENYVPPPATPAAASAPLAPALAPSEGGVAPGPDTAADTGSRGFFSWLGDSPAAVATVSVAALALGTSAVLAGFASNHYDAAENARDQIIEAQKLYISRGVLLATAQPCGEAGIANRPEDSFDQRATDDARTSLTEDFGNACSRFTERSDSGDRLKTLSLVSLGIGAFATIGTIVWYFSDSAEERASASPEPRSFRASVSPVLSPDTQGVWIDVQF